MPADLETIRKAQAWKTGRYLGLPINQPRVFVSQCKTAFHESDVLALPVDARAQQPLADANGNAYFMADYHPVDSGAVIR